MPPPDCDPEVFERGERIATVYGASSWAVELWVRAVAARADARVDWRQVAGRGLVLHLGDAASRSRVEDAMTVLAPRLAGRILERFQPSVVS